MDEAELIGWLDERVAAHAFRGTALVWQDGAPTFAYAGGHASRSHGLPVTHETRFAVASVTKMVTAVTALRLVELGLLDLRRPLTEVLPPEQRPAALTAEHTLHHLLSHTSGLPGYFDGTDQTRASWSACWDRIPTYHARRPVDLLPLFVDLPAVAPPGARYEYNDANFLLVGLAIEAATGRRWSDVAADEVLGPAGMVDSGIEALDDDPPRLATGYLTDDGPPERWRANLSSVTANGMPDGGMISTGPDLARLLDAVVGGRLLTPALTAAMTTPQGPPGDGIDWYGYGCELVVEEGTVTILGHAGSDPGVSAEAWHHVASGTTIVVLSNQGRGAWAAALRITDALGLRDPRA